MDWRNPFEEWRDKHLSAFNVKGYKVWLIRWGYIPYSPDKCTEYDMQVREIWGEEDVPIQFFLAGQTYRDLGVIKGEQPWITKFFNARFSLHRGVSVTQSGWRLPFWGMVFRFTKRHYFQIGLGFGPEGKYNAETGTYERTTLSGKFRHGEYKGEWYKGGNFDVYGYYEGIC